MIDFNKLRSETPKEIIEPSFIFASLPNKSKKYGYLRAVQSEVLKQWYKVRDRKNNIIKMNTGSGKTTVALLILQSCLNEGKGNAIYVVSDKYLIGQVKKEATDLGIAVTEDPEDIDFIRDKSILVITIQKLINGKTIFNKKVNIDNIVIDDVHACLDIAEQQFIIGIDRDRYGRLYDNIIDLFDKELEKQNYVNKLNIRGRIPTSNPMIVPFWEVREKYKDVCNLIEEYIQVDGNEEILFPYNFLKDIIKFCNICISYNRIEISPDCIPINKVASFCDASRRIFMSATLKDDGRLLKDFDIKQDDINSIITPPNAMDIGNRMILFPQSINTEIKDPDIAEYLKKISINKRIIVIVPSKRRSEFWKQYADRIFTKDNIETIKDYNKGLDIVINRYDGIDLTDDFCSYLVIDGLPCAKNLFEEINESITRETESSLQEKIQKIEQGMGRGIRSNLDNCAVVIMGKSLLNILYSKGAKDNFSESTRVQFELSEKVAEQLRNETLDEIMKTYDLCLNRNEKWLSVMTEELSKVKTYKKVSYNNDDIKLANAYRYAINGNYDKSIKCVQEIVNSENNEKIKGFEMYTLAKYTDFIDHTNAQEILLKAKEYNSDICIPREGYDYKPIKEKTINQAKNIYELINATYKKDIKMYLYSAQSVFSKLIFSGGNHVDFENSINDLCDILGFKGKMPEKETGIGPDNLWCLGKNTYAVIECKNEAVSETISKKDSGQLSTSMNWAKEKYGEDSKYQGIIIHHSNVFNYDACPNEGTRIIQEDNINKLEQNITEMCRMIQKEEITIELISEQLNKYKLTSDLFINSYTNKYEIKNK